jgi:Leucine-rich repeat (LRR) protein
LDGDVFSELVNLKYIGFSFKLQYLHPHTFLWLPNIQQVSLFNNPGLQIPSDRNFINSHSLSHLDISDCNVNSVPVETFTKVSVLQLLELNYNNLRNVDISILRALPKLSTLYLHGNQLQCDCQLQEVWRWCEERNIETEDEGIAPKCDVFKTVPIASKYSSRYIWHNRQITLPIIIICNKVMRTVPNTRMYILN